MECRLKPVQIEDLSPLLPFLQALPTGMDCQWTKQALLQTHVSLYGHCHKRYPQRHVHVLY